MSLLPLGALPKLFPTISLPSTLSSLPCRSFPSDLSPSYFPRFPFRSPSRCFRIGSPALCSPAISTLPTQLSPSYFHVLDPQFFGTIAFMEFVLKTRCQKLCILVPLSPYAALLQLFPRLGPTVFQDNRNDNICPEKNVATALTKPQQQLCIELSPSHFHGLNAASFPASDFPQAISTVSCPSSMLSRSLPEKLSASYVHSFLSVQHAVSLPPSEAFRKLFARFPILPACCLASSQRSSPQKLFARFPFRPASLPFSEALRKLFPPFPLRPACCLAPSQRSFPQTICTVSSPSSMLSRSLPAKLSPSYLHGFLSVQHAVSLPPNEALPKLFARFPVRPACCLAPSQRSSPQAICTVSSPSSMLSRSLPAKLSAIYFHGFLSVQHAVSLPPSKTLRKLFARFPLHPACCLAPSQRSSP